MPFLILFIPGFLCFWGLICAALSRAGGWHAVGREYRAAGKPEGRTFRMQAAEFGWVGYNGCLTITVSPDGLYLAVWPMVRFSHPPLLIPWSALSILSVRKSWWANDVTVSVGNPELARVRLPLKVVEAANEFRLQPLPRDNAPGDGGE